MLGLPASHPAQKQAATRPLQAAQHGMKAGRQKAGMQEVVRRAAAVVRRRMVTAARPHRCGFIKSLQGSQLVEVGLWRAQESSTPRGGGNGAD